MEFNSNFAYIQIIELTRNNSSASSVIASRFWIRKSSFLMFSYKQFTQAEWTNKDV
jgi:hypothetical protein